MAKTRKPRKTRPPISLDDQVTGIIRRWQWRWGRPGYLIARRALPSFQARLKEIERTRKWLRRQDWFDPEDSIVDYTLLPLEEQTRNEVKRLDKAARAPAVKPERLTPLLVQLAKVMYPKGMKKGERMAGCTKIAERLKAQKVKVIPEGKDEPEHITASNIRSLLEHYHQKHKGSSASPFK